MKNIYTFLQMALCICFLFPKTSKSQNCTLLQANCTTYESRCAATGSIKVRASGGSGNYKYKTIGPVNTNFTTLDSITGLSAGTYTVVVNDIMSNCTVSVSNVVIAGSYQDPRFNLTKVDVSCDNGNNGSIAVAGLQYGRAPFLYTIVAPSPMGVGMSNPSGIFNGLSAGDYSIRLTDSCGGIQTRIVSLNNYTWRIDAYPFTKTACDQATGFIRVIDSRGNISTSGGIPGMMYGIVRTAGDTLWSSSPNFVFRLMGHNSFQVVAKDSCGIIKRAPVSVSLTPDVGATVITSDLTCNGFSASVNNVINFFNGDFCLVGERDNIISCNNTGIFNDIPYGSYCIRAHDACTDTVISRCFTVSPPAISVDGNVLISNKTCTDFNVSITGQVGLTHPDYCLFDSTGLLISCNGNGVFNNLLYGSYCIQIRDGCIDTSFTRCFTVQRPTPVLHPVVPAYVNCVNFGVVVTGDSLMNPLYCLYDSNHVPVACNNTGIFDSIPLGNYCATVYDTCYDITLTECFSVSGPVIQNDINIRISNERCSTFTVSASSQGIDVAEFCLYDAADVLVSCNATGEFDNVPYGTYCIRARVTCPDTTVIACFTATGPVPSVNATVSVSNTTCTTFTASVTRFENLTNPEFCIYDNNNVQLSCNTRGVFDNLPYGSYCITVRDGCYDTLIRRCFTRMPTPVDISVNASKSCAYGYAYFNIGMGGAPLPVNVRIYLPDGTLLLNQFYSRNNITIDSIPGLPSGQFYKIVATDNCGNRDSATTGAIASYFNHAAAVRLKCPGGLWPNGSGNISETVSTNLGSISVRIIKRNGVTYSPFLTPDFVSGGVYTFYDLGPGTYIVRAGENDCDRYKYDTVVITNYQYPNLNRSSAYQCDINGFSVSAVATNGVSPYLYEIIGSVPAAPSIIAAPQASSIFTINNGSSYSLIRLRAVDACGNATLGDASILPLANNGIVVSNNCFMSPTTLSVDSIYNASYQWYKKENAGSTDSTYMGAASSLYIPMLTEADTGVYTCYVVVNAGCIKRTYHFNLNGLCYVVLPLPAQAILNGRITADKHLLYWDTDREEGLTGYTIERKAGTSTFTAIGQVEAGGSQGQMRHYEYYDRQPEKGNNYYRLKMAHANGSITYSNTINLGNTAAQDFTVFPNPAKDRYTIGFNASGSQRYKIVLMNNASQVVQQAFFSTAGNGKLEMLRPAGTPKGLYLLKIFNPDTGEEFTRKIVFL